MTMENTTRTWRDIISQQGLNTNTFTRELVGVCEVIWKLSHVAGTNNPTPGGGDPEGLSGARVACGERDTPPHHRGEVWDGL